MCVYFIKLTCGFCLLPTPLEMPVKLETMLAVKLNHTWVEMTKKPAAISHTGASKCMLTLLSMLLVLSWSLWRLSLNALSSCSSKLKVELKFIEVEVEDSVEDEEEVGSLPSRRLLTAASRALFLCRGTVSDTAVLSTKW